MKIPLRYQVSEYDCGPTSLLNALNYLFQREEISPELIRNIMLYSLDCYGSGGAPGKRGTSRMAMMFLSNWLDGVGKKRYPVWDKTWQVEDPNTFGTDEYDTPHNVKYWSVATRTGELTSWEHAPCRSGDRWCARAPS